MTSIMSILTNLMELETGSISTMMSSSATSKITSMRMANIMFPLEWLFIIQRMRSFIH